jgi:stringent starvation protein B
VPVEAVLAIYARENGKGMMFPADEDPDPGAGPDTPDAGEAPKRPRLRVVR